MSNCSHTGWLRLWKKNHQIILETSDRPRQLLKDIQNVDEPVGVIILIGNQTKSLAFSTLGLEYGLLAGRKRHGEYHLQVSHLRAKRPIIVGDGDIPSHNRLPRSCKLQHCHETADQPFLEEKSIAKAVEASDHIYHRLLSPFADVVCMFVGDIGGIDSAIRRLTAWADKGQSSTTPIRPALVLVVARGQKKPMLNAINAVSLGDHFRRIRVVTIYNNTRGLRSKRVQSKMCQPLRKELLRSLDLVQHDRLDSGLLFSARHTAEFLLAAPESAVKSPWEPFDFIKISRAKNPAAPDLSAHLVGFLKLIDDAALLKSFAIPLIASSFILDQYPPGMHSFKPQDVFHTFYHDACMQVSKDLETYREASNLPRLPFDLIPIIQDEVTKQFHRYKELQSSKDLHLQNLAHLCRHSIFPLSEESCLSCLRRRPQYRLPCGHWICQICVRIFHCPSPEDTWLFCVDKCILCGVDAGDLRIRVKPDTATARVLSIDGGGTRGRAPLEFLQVLQYAVALPYPVQRNFDIVYGTSSGAMTACALYINGWPIEKCIEYFELSSKLAFEKRQLFRLFIRLFGHLPIISPAVQFVISLLVDSKYSAERLEMIQQDVYGRDRAIVDSKEASEMGTLLGVTLTSTDDTSTFVVTNYNGAGERRDNSNYSVLDSSTGIHNVPLWEMVGKSYFTPHRIEGVGTFQDGGLTFNNPASIALKEAAAIFPAATEPSIVVSLGTGATSPSHDSDAPRRALWKDSFPARLSRAFWKQGDSSDAWKQLMAHQKLGGREEFFRFDIEFKAKQPALDDVEGMGEISRIAREAALGSVAMEKLAKCIRAELFLFELDPAHPPQLVSGNYEGIGYILCRLRAGTAEFDAFMRQLHHACASFRCQGRTLPDNFQVSPHVMINDDGNFRQRVAFHLPSRQHQLEISLQEGPSSICHISGSPFTLERLIRQQKLDAYFGTSDHRKRTRVDDTMKQPLKRQRLQ